MIFHGRVPTPHKVSCKELDDISPLSDVTRRVISMSNYNGFGCINFKFSANGFTQDVLDEHLREMRKLRLFDPTRGLKLSSWVALLAGNAARDFLRSHRRRPATLSTTGEVDRIDDRDLFEETASRERCSHALDALRTFPSQDQLLLLMLHVEEASVDEIARACGGSDKTVYTRAHRIRAQVRQRCNPAALAA